MKTRIIVAAIAIPVIFVILFFLPTAFLSAFVAVIDAFAALEFIRAVCPDVPARLRIYTLVCGIAVPFVALMLRAWAVMLGLLVIFAGLLFWEAIRTFGKDKQLGFDRICYLLFIGFVYPVMMSSLVGLKLMTPGRLYVLLPVIITFCCDSGAYFAGMYYGKRKVLPAVSPNKTAEGFIGGILAGVVCTLIYGLIVFVSTDLKVKFLLLLVYGIVGSVVVELGDLAYSVIKRQHDIKDYGDLIPGHGGMLDRFDSMSFAAPMIFALAALIPAF